ncbi:SEC-C metal-binding domain-containing protein [Streptomyces sp. NPDC091406]|uniref:SEC-C metal-binding domain-containing protein n=1 Tax=unclassified Streptomyces TaxID=2593676 RepID=UPI00380FFA88
MAPPQNGPCWCGDGRKYKKCHGSPAGQHGRSIRLPGSPPRTRIGCRRPCVPLDSARPTRRGYGVGMPAAPTLEGLR